MPDDLFLYAVLAAALAYVIFVNRKRQSYSRSGIIEAPIEAVWELFAFKPGGRKWVAAITSCVWEDEASRDMRVDYVAGQQLRMRIVAEEPRRYIETLARIRRTADAPYGDLMHSRSWLEPDGPDRTRCRSEIVIERGSFAVGFGSRLTYPFVNRFAANLMLKDLKSRGLLGERPRAAGASVAGMAWRIALVATTLGWLAWIMGIWTGLAVAGMLVVHEYGHVWSMRRNGHATARFFLVPFFGGVAIGSKRFDSDAEAAEIFLMGPVFGLAPALVAIALFFASEDAFFAQLAGLLALCNGLNLAPLTPLDGGRVTQVLVRPFGDKAWYAISGLLAFGGAVGAAYFRSGVLMSVALLGVWSWSAITAPNPSTRPLSGAGIVAVIAAYAVLAAIHAALFYWSLYVDAGGWLLDDGPAFLQ